MDIHGYDMLQYITIAMDMNYASDSQVQYPLNTCCCGSVVSSIAPFRTISALHLALGQCEWPTMRIKTGQVTQQ